MKKNYVLIFIGLGALLIMSVFLHSNQVKARNSDMNCATVPVGLISWWQGEGTGLDALVINNGTVGNGVTFVQGIVGNSFSFNGQGYVTVPDSATLNPVNFTIDAWIKRNSSTYDYGAIVVKKGGNDQSGYSLESSFGGIGFWVNILGKGWVESPAASINPDQWYHVAGVYDGSVISLYVNGVSVGTPTPSEGSIAFSNSALNIGHDTSHTERHYNGLIDEVHLFNRALSPAEIQEIYSAGSAGLCQNTLIRVRLPIVTNQIPSLSGKVTMNGSPASNVPLDLRFNDGTSWSTFASTTTDAKGNYIFQNAPALKNGQKYYVRYLNNSDPSRLYTWHTPENTTYGSVTTVVFDPFDIANIILQSPEPGATVSLPVTFTWTLRPASPNDNYEFNLFDPADGNPYYYTNPPLGYKNAYGLRSLPANFVKGVEYGWDIFVYSPDGGYGESYYYYPVTFK